MSNCQSRTEQTDEEINLLDYLLVILKRKWFIFVVTFGITLLAVIYSLITPKIYLAESKILPPSQNQSASSQLLAQLGGMAGGLGLTGMAGIKNSNDLYIGLLKSRPILDTIIDRFKLQTLYKARYKEEVRRTLLSHLQSRDDKKSGIITVGVEDNDPARAAAMANTFVEELKGLNRRIAITEASQRRLFYEEQMKDAKESLVKAEESMKGFQEKTGVIKIDEQAKAAIQGIGEMRAQIAAREVQLKVMRTYATQRNPDAQRLEEEVRGLKEQLARLEARGGQRPDPIMPTGRVAQLGTDYVRKMRDLKFNEALYEILLKQYEAAKLDEGRDANIIQVIEQAVPPELKVKPKRTQMVVIAFIVGLFCSIFGAFFLEYVERTRQNPINKGQIDQLRQFIRIRRK
jgi:uncharacterized protein involved in exopolysaccharide biosynthesis